MKWCKQSVKTLWNLQLRMKSSATGNLMPHDSSSTAWITQVPLHTTSQQPQWSSATAHLPPSSFPKFCIMIDNCTMFEGRQRNFYHCLDFKAINLNSISLHLLNFDHFILLRLHCMICLFHVSHGVINSWQFVTVVVRDPCNWFETFFSFCIS